MCVHVCMRVYVRSAHKYCPTPDNPRYVEANAGCKHFDVHGGPEDIPVSRFSFNAKVSHFQLLLMLDTLIPKLPWLHNMARLVTR